MEEMVAQMRAEGRHADADALDTMMAAPAISVVPTKTEKKTKKKTKKSKSNTPIASPPPEPVVEAAAPPETKALTTDRRAKALARKQQKQKQKALAKPAAFAQPQQVTPGAATTSESAAIADEEQHRPSAAREPAAVDHDEVAGRLRRQSALEESGLSAVEADAMLWDAAERGDCEAVKQCCAMLPSEHLNLLQCGSAPLHEATSNGHTEVVDLLLRQKANPDLPSRDGKTAVHLAAQAGKTDILAHLVAQDARLNARDKFGQTAVHVSVTQRAAGAQKEDVVNTMIKLLLSSKAAVDTADCWSQTPLHIAAADKSSFNTLQLLLEHNADRSPTDDRGQTAAHRAVATGSLESVQLLLHQADRCDWTLIQDNDGRTLVDLSLSREHEVLECVLGVPGTAHQVEQLLLDETAVWSRRVLRLLEECLERQQQAEAEANAEAEEAEEETLMLVESPTASESRTPIVSPSRDQIPSRLRTESALSEPDMLQESPTSANQTLGKPWWKKLACCMKSAQATPYSSVDFLNKSGEDALEPQTPPGVPQQRVQVSTLIGGARAQKINLGAPTGVARPVGSVAAVASNQNGQSTHTVPEVNDELVQRVLAQKQQSASARPKQRVSSSFQREGDVSQNGPGPRSSGKSPRTNAHSRGWKGKNGKRPPSKYT